MVQLRLHHRPEQRVLLTACTSSRRPGPAPAVRPLPGIADEVLADLRAEDAIHSELAAARAKLLLPMHNPAAARFLPALLAQAEHEKAARDAACRVLFAEDRARREDAAAAEWVSDAVAGMLAENITHIRAAIDAHPELARHRALLAELAPVAEQLHGLAFVAVDELPDWIQNNLTRPGTRAAIHRTAFGAPHLTSITPHASHAPSTGQTYHVCHRCAADPAIRGIGREHVPASTVTILTVIGEVDR